MADARSNGGPQATIASKRCELTSIPGAVNQHLVRWFVGGVARFTSSGHRGQSGGPCSGHDSEIAARALRSLQAFSIRHCCAGYSWQISMILMDLGEGLVLEHLDDKQRLRV